MCCVGVCGRLRGGQGCWGVVTAELQPLCSRWWHALCSHIHAQAEIMTMYLPAGIYCQLVVLSRWWNIGFTGLSFNNAFLIGVPFHVKISLRQNDNHGTKSHYAQSSITCAALIIAVSAQGLWAIISLSLTYTHTNTLTRMHILSLLLQNRVAVGAGGKWDYDQTVCETQYNHFFSINLWVE